MKYSSLSSSSFLFLYVSQLLNLDSIQSSTEPQTRGHELLKTYIENVFLELKLESRVPIYVIHAIEGFQKENHLFLFIKIIDKSKHSEFKQHYGKLLHQHSHKKQYIILHTTTSVITIVYRITANHIIIMKNKIMTTTTMMMIMINETIPKTLQSEFPTLTYIPIYIYIMYMYIKHYLFIFIPQG